MYNMTDMRSGIRDITNTKLLRSDSEALASSSVASINWDKDLLGTARRLFYENAELRETLTEVRRMTSEQLSDLENRLSSTESQLKISVSRADAPRGHEVPAEESETIQRKNVAATTEHLALEERLRQLERYLREVPTVEEFHALKAKVRSLRQKASSYKQLATAQSLRAEASDKDLREARFQIVDFTERERLMQSRMDSLEERLRRVSSGKGGAFSLDEGVPRKLCRDLIDDLRMESSLATNKAAALNKKLEEMQVAAEAALQHTRAKEKSLSEELEVSRKRVLELEDNVITMQHKFMQVKVEQQDLLEALAQEREFASAYRNLLRETADSPQLLDNLTHRLHCNLTQLSNVLEFCSQCANLQVDQQANLQLLTGVDDEGLTPQFESSSNSSLSSKIKDNIGFPEEMAKQLAVCLSQERLRQQLLNSQHQSQQLQMLTRRLTDNYATYLSHQLQCGIM